MRGKLTAAFAVVATAVSISAMAQSVGSFSQDGRPERMPGIHFNKGLNGADFKMLQDIYWGNSFEIHASEIAQNRAQSPWAKEFAKEMIHEHTMAQNELKLLANNKVARLGNNLPSSMQNELRRLRNIPSYAFDAEFRRSQLSAHAMASQILKRTIRYGHDQDVRGLAVKFLPPVKDHYALAQIRRTMMGPTRVTNGV
jgi:putative membrane protein